MDWASFHLSPSAAVASGIRREALGTGPPDGGAPDDDDDEEGREDDSESDDDDAEGHDDDAESDKDIPEPSNAETADKPEDEGANCENDGAEGDFG